MKFSFRKQDILEILAKIQGITGRKTNLSITSDILIKAMGSEISITATDMETVFSGTYEAQVHSEGALSINSKKFFEIVREYPENEILVNEVENRWVEIGKGDSLFHIVSSDYQNFPEIPLIEQVDFIEISARDLKKMVEISSIIGFISEERRIYVMGSLLEKISFNGQEKLRMVSTDSRRLNCYDADFKGELNFPEESVIIPKKGLAELSKFIDSNLDLIQVGVKKNHFVFQRVNEVVMIKLLEGDYPDYKPIMNFRETFLPLEMDKNIFFTLMKRVSILTSADYKSVLLNFRENELTVTITNPEIGESKERLMIGYTGEEIKSAFNPRYFLDALNLFDDSVVVIHVKDSKSPCIIKGFDDDKLICVIMAMHIS